MVAPGGRKRTVHAPAAGRIPDGSRRQSRPARRSQAGFYLSTSILTLCRSRRLPPVFCSTNTAATRSQPAIPQSLLDVAAVVAVACAGAGEGDVPLFAPGEQMALPCRFRSPFGPLAFEATGTRSMMSYCMFFEDDDGVIAGLNLRSTRIDAFDDGARAVGMLLATRSAQIMSAASASCRDKATAGLVWPPHETRRGAISMSSTV
jgi:hypothetical protein